MDCEPTSAHAPLDNSGFIVLDVGGRKYRTYKSTLDESEWFRNFFDRWDDPSIRQQDGSFFVDADPDVFKHVLAFMRRPSTFPLFWTKEKGFDLDLYNGLAAEADYFGLHGLRDWITSHGFRRAVQTSIVTKVDPLYPTLYEFQIGGTIDSLSSQTLEIPRRPQEGLFSSPPSPSAEDVQDDGDYDGAIDITHIDTRFIGPNGDKKFFCPRGYDNHLVLEHCINENEPADSCFRVVSQELERLVEPAEAFRFNKGTVVTTYRKTKVDLHACNAHSVS